MSEKPPPKRDDLRNFLRCIYSENSDSPDGELDTKRAPAAASLVRVRVIKNKSFSVKSVGKIQLRSGKEEQALGINIDFYLFDLKYLVGRFRFAIETEDIGKSGASAPLHADAQSMRFGDIVLHLDLPHLLKSLLGESNFLVEDRFCG